MRIGSDENKRLANIAKHKLDFADAASHLAAPYLTARARTVGIEERWLAIGRLGTAFVTLVFAPREETLRVISLLRARNEEAKRYRQLLGG
ncbi:MAG TPA: BrnT family toxin [Burkholderiales bacterium]|nr:BrnT family toxin [Burkholderiales bacterium]